MPTQIIRRIYLYVAAFVGLQMLAGGIGSLFTFIGERLVEGASIAAPGTIAARLGTSIALIAVGAPLWWGHWHFAQRDAQQPEGRRSALRRFYAYAVLLVAAITVMFSMQEAVSVVLEGLGAAQTALVALITALVTAIVSAVIWFTHWRIFAADRTEVERTPPNATLRRWYFALTLWMSLAFASFGAGVLIHGLLRRFVFGEPGFAQQLAMPAGALISGLAIWLPHEIWSRRMIRTPGPLLTDELGAPLRQVYTALVITASLIAALTGLTALLSAGLRALLGVAGWSAAFAGETRGAAALVVALPVLFYYREQLMLNARLSSAERANTARRIISYLMGAVSLVALYFGLGGLVGTTLRMWLGASAVGVDWRTPLSWYAALAVVALLVYALASRSSERLAGASPDEARTLSRRIYLYVALLFGVIATVITATQLIRLVVVTVVGVGAGGAAGEIGRLVGYTLLGGAIAATYGVLLRRAGAARGTTGAGQTIMVVADPPFCQLLEAALAHELPGATIIAYAEHDSPERRAALADADLLLLPLAALNDPAFAAFNGPKLLLTTPVPNVIVVGARRPGAGLAREAARTAREISLDRPAKPEPPPARFTHLPGTA